MGLTTRASPTHRRNDTEFYARRGGSRPGVHNARMETQLWHKGTTTAI